MGLSAEIATRIIKLATGGSKFLEKSNTRVTGIVGENYLGKIAIFGKNSKLGEKFGLTRTIREYLPNGQEVMTAEFSTKSALQDCLGGMRKLRGTPKQMAKTFQFLHRTVDENCNTLTALDNLEKLRSIVGDVFAKRV